jgi:hypothetical protein
MCYTFNINTEHSTMTPTKSAYLSVRLPDKTRIKFHAKARKFGTPSEVLRELVEAFIDDRLTIQPPVTSNPKDKLYVTRTEN